MTLSKRKKSREAYPEKTQILKLWDQNFYNKHYEYIKYANVEMINNNCEQMEISLGKMATVKTTK